MRTCGRQNLKHLNSFVPTYDVLQYFLSISSGLTYRQLLRDDAERAQKNPRRVIKDQMVRRNVSQQFYFAMKYSNIEMAIGD